MRFVAAFMKGWLIFNILLFLKKIHTNLEETGLEEEYKYDG